MKLPTLLLTVLLFLASVGPAQASGWLPPAQQDRSSSIELPDRWQETRAGRFVLHYEPEDASLAGFFAERAEVDLQRIEEELGTAVTGPIHVYVTRRARDFMRLQPGQPPPWAAATAWPRQRLIFLKSGLDARSELYTTFVHELSHLAVGAALSGHDLPRWFKEGLAQYHAGEWGFERWRQLTYGIMTGQVGGFSELEHHFRTSFSSTAGIAYAQSAHFFSWLAANYGDEALPELLLQLRDGHTVEEALTIVTGQQRWQVESRWLSSMRWRQAWIPAMSGGGFFWGVAMVLTLPAWIRRRRQYRAKLRALDAQEQRLSLEPADTPDPAILAFNSNALPGHDAFFTPAPLELGLGSAKRPPVERARGRDLN